MYLKLQNYSNFLNENSHKNLNYMRCELKASRINYPYQI